MSFFQCFLKIVILTSVFFYIDTPLEENLSTMTVVRVELRESKIPLCLHLEAIAKKIPP